MLRDTNQKETFMRRIPLLAGVIGLSLLAAPTFAAPAGPKRPNAAAKHKADPAKRDARRLAGLKAAGVDDARAQKALGTMKKFDAERKAVAESTRSSRQALKKLIQSKSSDENAYRTALSSLNAARKKMQGIQDRELAALGQILKPSEQAKLLAARRGAKRGPKR